MTEEKGSIFYIPPEVLQLKYTKSCDLWSLGVIAFSLLTGRFPFDDISEDEEIIKKKILEEKLSFDPSEKLFTTHKAR